MTDNTAIISVLNKALRAKFHSLARYALEASPYATREDLPMVEILERIAQEDWDLASEINERIESLDGIPEPGLPDPLVAEIAFLSVARLIRDCVDSKREIEGLIRKDLGGIQGSGDPAGATALLHRMANSERDQANALEKALA